MSRWVDVTPLVFVLNTAAGWLGILVGPAALVLFPWAGPVGLLAVLTPPALARVAWRAYCERRGDRVPVARIGRAAFWASASWPLCVIGSIGGGGWLVSRIIDTSTLDDAAGEMWALLLFCAGAGMAAIVCSVLSRRIAHTLWPRPGE